MNRAVVLAFAIVCGVALAACADLLGFKDLHEPDAAGDAGPDALPDTGVDAYVCDLAGRPPDAPASDDPGGDPDAGGAGGFVLAMRHVFFTSSSDAGVMGYNLDKKCTSSVPTASCNPPATTDPTTIHDGPGGVDNESTQLFQQLQVLVSSLNNQAFDDEIANGDFTLLLRLLLYKGIANQAHTSGMFAVQASPGAKNVPAFDGTDTWVVASDDTLGGATLIPTVRSDAYVANNTLVASYSGTVSVRVLLPPGGVATGPLAVTLHAPMLTGTLVKRSDGRYDMTNGVIVGRWATSDMIAAVASLNVSNSPLCGTGLIFDNVVSTLCSMRDLVSDPINDNGDNSCDAVSVAIGFDAVAAYYDPNQAPFPASTTPCLQDAGACPP
jgi:hypothetical protein